MARLLTFMSVSLDGCFADAQGGVGFAHAGSDDPEWQAFVAGNASGGGRLLFGRVTYDMMKSYWPTPMAAQNDPVVAERMNAYEKYVISRTLTEATWRNTTLLKGDLVAEVTKLKQGGDVAILGSGSLVAQLGEAGLIDDFQIVTCPSVLGDGKRLFAGVKKPFDLKLTSTRSFKNGKVVLNYERA
ncbi:MAG TPA: dihydrofolate reductase family protein [Gemmatimonadaceae bacterium]|jgi:dihydrofolate reductase